MNGVGKPKKCCFAYAEIIHNMNNCGGSCVLLRLVDIRTNLRNQMASYLRWLRKENFDPEEPTEEQGEVSVRYDECLRLLNMINKHLEPKEKP